MNDNVNIHYNIYIGNVNLPNSAFTDMRILTKLSVILLILIINSGCKFNSQYLNRESDKADAEEIAYQFFELLKNKNYDQTLALYSKQFLKVTPKEKLVNIYKATHEKLGALESTELVEWETKVIEGSNPLSDYNLIYKTKHQKFEAVESIRLTKESNGKIKILAYNINSEGFMQ